MADTSSGRKQSLASMMGRDDSPDTGLASWLRIAREATDPWQFVSPQDVASNLPGGGLPAAWQESGRGRDALKQGRYADAASAYGNMLLNMVPEGTSLAKLAAVFGPGVYRVFKGYHPYTGGDVTDWKGKVLESTPEVPIEQFKDNAFFSSDPEVANRFAQAVTNRGAVFSGDLEVKNPKIFDATGKPAAAFQFYNTGAPKDIVDEYRKALSDPRFDAVILSNTLDEGDVFIPKANNQPKPNFKKKGD